MTTMRTMMIALLMTLGAGCQPQQISYDAKASADYRAAWQKKVAGDTDGYRAGLKQVAARYPMTRAGVRAKEELSPQATTPGMAGFFSMLAQVAKSAVPMPAQQ